MPRTDHLIGLLLGAEEDWPTAFEALARRLGVLTAPDGTRHTISTERVSIEPFNLRDRPRHELVIDRLAACAHWSHAESCEWAVRLLRVAEAVDVDYLIQRAREADVVAELERAMREAGAQ